MSSTTIHIPLTPFDHIPPAFYTVTILYLPLKPGVSPIQAFEILQRGLHRTFATLPWLSGKVWPQDPKTPGWRPGQLEIRHGPVDINGPLPYQLKFKQVESPFSYEELKEQSFPSDAFEYEDLMWAPFVPDLNGGCEVFVGQASFIPGACILTKAIFHAVGDGAADSIIVRLWSEHCSAMQSQNVIPSELAPGSSDRTLVEQIWAKEGTGKSVDEIGSEVWGMFGLEKPGSKPTILSNGHKEIQTPKTNLRSPEMKSATFYISPSAFATLREECAQELGETTQVSGNDALCALIWRFLIRARSAAAAKTASKPPGKDVKATLTTFIDGRSDFSQSLPPTYLGNFALESHSSIPLESLTSSKVGIASIAKVIRSTASVFNTANWMDAYTVANSLHSFADLRDWKLQREGRVGDYTMIITSLLLFQAENVSFGNQIFDNGGSPEGTGLFMASLKKWTRICVVLPWKKNGGIEFVFNLFDYEMDVLLDDDEFGRYALFVS